MRLHSHTSTEIFQAARKESDGTSNKIVKNMHSNKGNLSSQPSDDVVNIPRKPRFITMCIFYKLSMKKRN